LFAWRIATTKIAAGEVRMRIAESESLVASMQLQYEAAITNNGPNDKNTHISPRPIYFSGTEPALYKTANITPDAYIHKYADLVSPSAGIVEIKDKNHTKFRFVNTHGNSVFVTNSSTMVRSPEVSNLSRPLLKSQNEFNKFADACSASIPVPKTAAWNTEIFPWIESNVYVIRRGDRAAGNDQGLIAIRIRGNNDLPSFEDDVVLDRV
jgi:hypothetical protein